MDPDGPDRLTRIEQQLQKLEAHNRRLQKRYNDLSRKYESLLQQGNDPIFGGRAGNSDGMGIPGGLELQPAAFLQEQEKSPKQTGEGGADETSGEKEGSGELEAEEEAEEPPPPPLQPAPRRRAQTGTSGGAGQVIQPVPPTMMADYVNRRGPYEPDMRPLRMTASVSFREGLEVRAPDRADALKIHKSLLHKKLRH